MSCQPNPQIVCESICVQKPAIGVDSEFVHADGCVSGTCRQCGDIVEALDPSRCFYCLAILCYGCWDETLGSCRGCIADIARGRRKIKAQIQAMHKSKVGRPKVGAVCLHCGNRFGARELRRHKPICVKLTAAERTA